MKIAIATIPNKDKIAVIKEYDNIEDKGQVAHIVMELERIKMDLIDIWEEMIDEEEDIEEFEV